MDPTVLKKPAHLSMMFLNGRSVSAISTLRGPDHIFSVRSAFSTIREPIRLFLALRFFFRAGRSPVWEVIIRRRRMCGAMAVPSWGGWRKKVGGRVSGLTLLNFEKMIVVSMPRSPGELARF